MRYLLRSKHYQKNEPSKDAKKVYLVCEGSVNEISYFKFFENFSSNLEIIPIPSENGKTDPLKLKEKAITLFLGDEKNDIEPVYKINTEYGDQIWFIIDTDHWNTGDKIEKLKSFCSSENTSFEIWHVAQSNPCFEQWQYYHFFDKPPVHEQVLECISFKEFVRNNIKGGFDNRKHPLDIDIATKNSEATFILQNNQPQIYCTELFILGKIILGFIESDLLTAKKMNGDNTSGTVPPSV